MTRHAAQVQVGERTVEVLVCWERGMGGFSMDVTDTETGVVVYDTAQDRRLWDDLFRSPLCPRMALEFQELLGRLAELCLDLPAGMLEALRADGDSNAAPYVRRWSA